MKTRFSLCLIFLIIFSGFLPLRSQSAVEYQTHTDFIASADKAKWVSSYGEQAFPGKLGSRSGAAYWLKNVTMENGVVYPLILQTTPDLKANGYIMGTYPGITIPENARLNVEFGFPKNADKTKGVTFSVSFSPSSTTNKPTIMVMISKFKLYSKDTEKVIYNLADFAGKKGNFVVMAFGGRTPTMSDVASWSKLLLEVEKPPKLFPDLIIKDIKTNEGKVSYTIQNIGTGITPLLRKGVTYNTRLTLDGREVSIDKLSSQLNPNESMVRTFPDYLLPKSRVDQTLSACADYNTIIEESNERNNCMQKVIPPDVAEEYPDLVITKITIENNRVSYTLKNNGPGATNKIRRGKVFQTSLSLDGTVLVLDTLLKGLNSQDQVTRTFSDFLLPSSKEEQTIVICADADDAFQETNERNNCLQKIIPPVPAEEYPDLIISKVTVDQGKVSYTIKNIGRGSTLTLFKGKTIRNNLTLDGIEVAADNMSQGLVPSQEITRTFPIFLLPPSKNEQILRVCADFSNSIQETNERNNCLEKNVPPEPTEEDPLRFTKLPEVTAITSKSAKITWETNRECNSIVFYDLRYSFFAQAQSDDSMVKVHEITLNDLNPDSVYNFFVSSTDREGEAIHSARNILKTKPEQLTIKPTLRFTLTGKLRGKIRIKPVLSDDKHFKKLKLFLDGKLVFSHYTKPFEMELDTLKFPNGKHELKIEGLDINGNLISAAQEGVFFNPELVINLGPIVDITSPEADYEFPNTTTEILVKATINHLSGLDIKSVYVYVDDHLVSSTNISKHKRNKIWSTFEELPQGFDCSVTISKFGEGGTHDIEVKAIDSAGKATSDKISIITHTPYWKRPSLTCYYGASIKAWTGNHYMIDFYVANNGTATAKNINIHVNQDFLPGFIITNLNPITMTSFDWENHQQVLHINLSELGYETNNKVYHMTFDLAPVLTPYCDWEDFVIFTEVEMCYDWDENLDPPEVYTLDISQEAGIETEWMAGNCDYLIASNYNALIDNTTPTTRNPLQNLLKNMSLLANKRQGIVGLIDNSVPGPFTARARMHNMGSKLMNNWNTLGYLLVVGETEIVPSFAMSLGSGEDRMDFESDAIYANTAGNYNSPELTIGRIIGDTVQSLSRPIKASLDVINDLANFRRNDHPSSNAYCLSGTGDGELSFWNNTDEVREILENEMHTVYAKRSKTLINDGQNVHQDIRDHCNSLSILFWRDHGGTHCWCDGVRVADSRASESSFAGNFNFGFYRPFIFACCCDSGTYSGIYGIANCLMEKASTYIGATEVSGRGSNNTYGKYFFNRWVDHPTKSLASAFKETRIESRNDTLWNLEYQFYGDVKFGSVTP